MGCILYFMEKKAVFPSQVSAEIKPNKHIVYDLAKYFNVNPKTIYRRLWDKKIPAYKIGRKWRIAKKDIKWLRQ